MTYSTLELQRRDGVAWITLDRPDRLNALTGDMYLDLERAAAECEADPEVGAIVLTGRGRAFCAGADLKTYTTEVDVQDPHSVRDRMRLIARVVRAWTNLDTPTIAAVNGAAVGGGANLALMCDLVLMREDAKIAQNYARHGFVLDMGGTYFLPRLVGRARAMELALLGDSIGAAEAERIGLVNRCIPAESWEADVDEYARRVAATLPRAAELILTGLRHAPTMDLDTTLEWEANAIALALSTPQARARLPPPRGRVMLGDRGRDAAPRRHLRARRGPPRQLLSALGTEAPEDGSAHPLCAWVIAMGGCGISIGELFEAAGVPMEDGPMLGACDLELVKPIGRRDDVHREPARSRRWSRRPAASSAASTS